MCRSSVLQPFKAWQVLGIGQMEENVQSHVGAGHAFIQGWASHACWKLHAPQWGAPTPLYTKIQTKSAGC